MQDRLRALSHGLGLELHDDPMRTGYYATLDVEAWAVKNVGPDFMAYVKAHRNPLELVFTLAQRHGTVLLNGSGFLSVYVAALILGSGELPYRAGLVRVHDALAWLSQIVMFLLLGLLVFPSRLLEAAWTGLALGLLLAFIGRRP